MGGVLLNPLLLGTLGGLFGIGGGLIAIPVPGVLFGLDQQLAQGTALVMVVPNVLLAFWCYHQRNRINPRHAMALACSSFCFAWLGAQVAVLLDAGRMRLAFIVFLLVRAACSESMMRSWPRLCSPVSSGLPKSSPRDFRWPWRRRVRRSPCSPMPCMGRSTGPGVSLW